MSYKRRIGYYELFNLHERLCDKVYPEDLEVSPLTHINLAFVLFDSSFKMIDEDGELISRVSFLKSRYRGLRVNVAIGGWAFNDPPTQTRFSDSRFLHEILKGAGLTDCSGQHRSQPSGFHRFFGIVSAQIWLGRC